MTSGNYGFNTPPQKIGIFRLGLDQSIVGVFQAHFNPSEIRRNRSAKYDFMDAAGTYGSFAEFVKSTDSTISLSIYLSCLRARMTADDRVRSKAIGIRQELAEMESWVLPELDLAVLDNYRFVSPPKLMLTINHRAYRCVATDVSITEKSFDSNLNPTSAIVDVTFQTTHRAIDELKTSLAILELDRAKDVVSISEDGFEDIAITSEGD